MEALEFLKEYKRMCVKYKGCYGCPLNGTTCSIDSDLSEEQMINIIDKTEQWSKEHPKHGGENMSTENVNHPSHYTQGGIECIAAIKASMTPEGFQDYCKGNVLKYVWRWRDKGGVEDLEKAKVYLTWMIESAKEPT